MLMVFFSEIFFLLVKCSYVFMGEIIVVFTEEQFVKKVAELNFVKNGDIICIRGNFLKFDETNENHGIFLSDGENEYRLTYYTQISAGTVSARIEDSIPSGSYALIVRNKPTADESTVKYKKSIVIS